MDTTAPLVPEIDFKRTRPSKQITDEIHERVQQLQNLYQQILHCRVRLDEPHTRQRTGTEYVVAVEISVPGDRLVVRRKHRGDIVTAIQDAFDAAERQVQDYARKRRGHVKRHSEERLEGTVREIYPLAGYGFVETEAGDRVYFDKNSVLDNKFAQMRTGQRVRFIQVMGEKGPQASTVYP